MLPRSTSLCYTCYRTADPSATLLTIVNLPSILKTPNSLFRGIYTRQSQPNTNTKNNNIVHLFRNTTRTTPLLRGIPCEKTRKTEHRLRHLSRHNSIPNTKLTEHPPLLCHSTSSHSIPCHLRSAYETPIESNNKGDGEISTSIDPSNSKTDCSRPKFSALQRFAAFLLCRMNNRSPPYAHITRKKNRHGPTERET